MRNLLLSLLALAASCLELAASGPGTSSADFLKIGLGARAVGMGGSFVGIADDASAIYWNPAGLSQMLQQEVGFLHTQWLNGITYEYGLYAYPHARWGTWAASLSLLQKNSIPSYDETGAGLGDVSVSHSVWSLGWGRSLFSENLALGVGVKRIQEDLAGFSANSYAVDLGSLFSIYEHPVFRVAAGASVRHLGSHGAFISESEPLPRTLVLGLGMKAFDERLSLGLDGVFPRDQKVGYFTLGAEYWVHPMISVRAGYKSGADIGTGFSAGAGVRIQAFQFDYAVADFGALGLTHRGGVSFRFGGKLGSYYEEGLKLMRQGNYAEAFLKFNKILAFRPNDRKVILRMKECQQKIQTELLELKKMEGESIKP
ncbi:MAG: PorV/PorQ family protein [Elusimicrobia bacterium]|nr:PorV/PorQ family protein [Elusimicrobiota bacterium]